MVRYSFDNLETGEIRKMINDISVPATVDRKDIPEDVKQFLEKAEEEIERRRYQEIRKVMKQCERPEKHILIDFKE